MEDYGKEPEYTFDIESYNGVPARVYRKGDVPDFKINDELRAAVYKNMPEGLTCEEKALFIYFRLCCLLDYDVDFLFKCIWNTQYILEMDEDIVSNIKPNSNIVCGEFSAIYFQLLSEIEGVEPVIIEQKKDGDSRHYLNGFYTQNLSLNCEAVNVMRSETYFEDNTPYTYSANDLARVKAGIEPKGLSGIYPKETFPMTIHDIFVSSTGMEPVMNYENMFYEAQQEYIEEQEHNQEQVSEDLDALIQEFHDAPDTDIPDSGEVFEMKFRAFLKVLERYGIRDNSAYISFFNLDEIGFFGGKTTDTRIGERQVVDGRTKFQRKVILQREDTPIMFFFDPAKLELSTCQREEVEYNICSHKWIYEKPDEKII